MDILNKIKNESKNIAEGAVDTATVFGSMVKDTFTGRNDTNKVMDDVISKRRPKDEPEMVQNKDYSHPVFSSGTTENVLQNKGIGKMK